MKEQFTNVTSIGDRVLVRGVDKNNKRFSEEVGYEPYAFLESNTETEFKSIDGKYLKRYDTPSLSEFYQFKKRCKAQDINVYGMDNVITQYMSDSFSTDYNIKNTRIFYVDIENKMTDAEGNRFGIDPEGAYGEITAITLYNSYDDSYQVFGNGTWKNNEYQHLNLEYHYCQDEFELLSKFVDYWSRNYPDIVSGWNSNGYDIPYLVNRITSVISEATSKKLSPWKKITKRSFINDIGKDVIEYKLYGISCVDYIDVYKKNTFSGRESYALDYISNFELGRGKVDYKSEGYSDLDHLYNENYQLYIDYNIFDVESLIEIDKKNDFMSIVVGLAHYSLVNYDEVYSVMRFWDSIRHRYMREHGMVTSPKKYHSKSDKFTGAYVKTPVPDKYRWIMTFDLTSLYPSIIMTGNIGDETMLPADEIPMELSDLYNRDLVKDILEYKITDEHHKSLVDNNITMTANGMFYHNTEKSINTNLYDVVLGERRIAKNKMLEYKDKLEHAKSSGEDTTEIKNNIARYNNEQLVKKVAANSLYGILGNQYYRYFDIRLAESVTLTGQVIIKWSELKVNQYLNKILDTTDVDYIIAIDTDSIMVNFEPFVNKMKTGDIDKTVSFLDKVGDQINVKLAEFYDELGTILNSTNNKMSMKREAIADVGIFKAKKMYALSVRNNEGVSYDKANYKIMGLEIVRSTTPKYIKERLKKSLIMILSDCTRSEMLDYINIVKDEYFKLTDITDYGFPSGCNNVGKYSDNRTLYKNRTPIHVRGAILFNKYYADGYNKIEDGDKIRYTYLKLPNPIKENVISTKDGIVPDELKPFIDYNKNFEKIFEKPVSGLTDILKWSLNDTVSLADLL